MNHNIAELMESPLVCAMLDKAGRLGIPTRAEEKYLIIMAQKGDRERREELSIRHTPFVITQVKRMGPWGLEYLDLFQEGMIGLDMAIDKFDTEKYNLRFISYAVWWIRQAMMIAAQNTAGTIRVPVNRHRDLMAIRRMVATGRTPTFREVMKKFKVTEPVARGLLDAANPTMSLNAITRQSSGGDDESEVGDFFPAPFNDDIADESEAAWAVKLIEEDKRMTAREKYIIVQRLYVGRSLDDIGMEMGVSRERIRQIQREAMVRVRRIAADYDRRCGFTAGDRRSMLSMGG